LGRDLTVPPFVDAVFMAVENLGDLMTSRVHALHYASTHKEDYDYVFLVDGNLSIATDTLELYLSEVTNEQRPIAVADTVPGKYNVPSPLEKVTDFNPSVMLVDTDFAEQVAEYLDGIQHGEEYWRPGAGLSACMLVIDTESARIDLDTQAYWVAPAGFVPPIVHMAPTQEAEGDEGDAEGEQYAEISDQAYVEIPEDDEEGAAQ
jgi:hypothetical protein